MRILASYYCPISFLSLLLCWRFIPLDLPQTDRVAIDNFDDALSESWRGRYSDFATTYTIKSEADNRYLAASSEKSDNFIIKAIKVDISQYPYINWRWRARTLPVAGDESVKNKCDVTASISIVLNKSKLLPKSIKYSWSSTLAKGTQTSSPYAIWPSRCDVLVKESGSDLAGQWITEKVNLLEDYQRLYKKKRVKSKFVYALVIMTDSDNTGTLAEADYDDIFFSKE